jgi:hypothetical protein
MKLFALRVLAVGVAAVLGAGFFDGCGSSHESSLERAERQVNEEMANESPTERRASMRRTEASQRRWERRQREKHRKAREREEAGGPPADWTREEKQQFEIAKSVCASEPLSQLASEWHTSVDPSSVAHAYGREYRLRQDMEIATEEGCLAALIE